MHYNQVGTELAHALTIINDGFSRHADTALHMGINDLEKKITTLQGLAQYGGVKIKASSPETFDEKSRK